VRAFAVESLKRAAVAYGTAPNPPAPIVIVHSIKRILLELVGVIESVVTSAPSVICGIVSSKGITALIP
jgi:hypothetical protein